MDCSLDARALSKRHDNLTTVQLITTPETGGYISGSRTVFVEGCRMVGAAGFYPFPDKGWRMRWVWIHPFWRGKGILAKEWPRFVELFGADFFPEPPLSVAMRAFLKKHMTRVQQRLWFPRYERGKPTKD
jgi:GNAT superfamily N-acetyltransferase